MDSGPTRSRKAVQAGLASHMDISHPCSLDSPLPFESTTLEKPRKRSAVSLGLCDLMPPERRLPFVSGSEAAPGQASGARVREPSQGLAGG